ncbi:glycosyltransferase family 4 protein [Bacillus sp. JJ1764]|uniref:glycosyltransferase family 4 protein n=1 Tax=Bacillus sp. JJ1764 TaxID=3122964 RepID=UPI002FFE21CE
MRIAIFTDTFYPDINGVARTLKRYASFLDQQHIPYRIFAPNPATLPSDSKHTLYFNSFPFFLYPECRLALPKPAMVKTEIQKFAPDLIHVATPFNIGLSGLYFSKKFKIPLVGSYHTDFDYYLQFYRLSFLSTSLWTYMNWFYRSCKKLFVPSQETLNQLKDRGYTNLEIWPRGVDSDTFHPFYEKSDVRKQLGISKKFLLTYVGRLAPEKDVKTLLSAAKALPSEINDHVQWLVIGDGPERKELEKAAPANMKFTGYIAGEELAKIYSSSDLFVFPSPTETFGNVVLEALASGTPAICANSGGVKNIINPGVTGELCTPGDPAEFANAIQKLLLNESLREQMGLAGRRYALAQNWETIFKHLLQHYSTVIEENKMKNIV